MTQPVPLTGLSCFFHQVLGIAPDDTIFKEHISTLYGGNVDELTPTADAVKVFRDCEYHTFNVSSSQHTTRIEYCFDRSADNSTLLSLGAVHLTGSSIPIMRFTLPGGIQLSFTGKQVVAALGEPERKGGQHSTTGLSSLSSLSSTSSTSGVWMAWDSLGVQVELSAIDWEHPEATIREIILYKPSGGN
ncbi:hypothetical protein BDF22DRAFT_411007 [Syncephalis plumigaleata]|nr:hypothetical protein BDF22DRAFT_411007 [Syncephalis plumigaleata]